jgi:hypothetical protein
MLGPRPRLSEDFLSRFECHTKRSRFTAPSRLKPLVYVNLSAIAARQPRPPSCLGSARCSGVGTRESDTGRQLTASWRAYMSQAT